MRRLLRLIWWSAVLAAVVWLLRHRLVPASETTLDPPRYPVAPPSPPAGAAAADDLEAIKGIGPVYAARLAESGVATFATLAAADAGDLANELDLRAEQTAAWIDQARGLAE